MPTFDIAQVGEPGREAVVVFVGRPVSDEETLALQICASQNGLSGTVIPVWKDKGGGFGFRAPIAWQEHFETVDWATVVADVAGKLDCT